MARKSCLSCYGFVFVTSHVSCAGARPPPRRPDPTSYTGAPGSLRSHMLQYSCSGGATEIGYFDNR
eukprot:2946580-Prymnesium_polylepis.1